LYIKFICVTFTTSNNGVWWKTKIKMKNLGNEKIRIYENNVARKSYPSGWRKFSKCQAPEFNKNSLMEIGFDIQDVNSDKFGKFIEVQANLFGF